MFLSTQHRYEEATRSAQKEVQIDPLSPLVHGITGLALACARMNEEALRNSSRALELHPNFVLSLLKVEKILPYALLGMTLVTGLVDAISHLLRSGRESVDQDSASTVYGAF